MLLPVCVQAQPLLGAWKFEAVCITPNSTIDGTFNIVFDSAGRMIGGIHFEDKVLPFHGRHLGDRVLLRTDTGHFPIVRVDCTLDSAGAMMKGVLTISKVKAMEPGKAPKDYYNLAYEVYSGRSGVPLRPKKGKKKYK